MTLWAIILVVVGVVLTVSGANTRLSAKLDPPSPQTPAGSSRGRLTLRIGGVLVLAGLVLFALSVVVHLLTGILTVAVIVALVVGVLAVAGKLRRPRGSP